ncbi:sensor domain-containing phosphodiesterase [Enterobacter sp. Ap-916]|uniref:EAL domain-containing protein n=2 Tax=Enterobacterales TaxID=91347 RepID=UPI00142404E2|nr:MULTISPECIES: EAL domain-containing protein [unclassified Enterobacter]NIF56830.1 sensor domain-containing phosphodiesterase [Enterobacter sp. Ap-867]NIG29229.1 sensor domain-containing phosphodiesterase [Enterobacter sp. Ap-916]
MQLASWYKQSKSKWWALPLILPSLLLPLVATFNAQTVLDGGRVFLLYMSLPLLTACIVLFGRAAIPGIVLALLIRYLPSEGVWISLLAVLHFIVPITVSSCCYRYFVSRRSAVTFGLIQLTAQRMFWLVLVNAGLFLVFYEIALFLGWYDRSFSILSATPWSARTLINFQAVLVGGLTGLPFFYFILRMIVHPRFIKSFWSRMRGQRQKGVTRSEMLLWAALIGLLIWLLLYPISQNKTIFNTDYTLTLILPVMLWGAMRFGFLFITNAWTVVLIILCGGFHNYLPPDMGFQLHLAIASSCYAVFSITIYLMAAVTTRQRFLHYKARRVAFIDPMMQMPNLRALSRDLGNTPWSALGFLSIPELELLGRNYGVLLRIQYKQQLAEYLRGQLSPGERVYNLSGHDLALRLNYESHQAKIESLYAHARRFRFMWDGMPLQPQIGISYCFVRHPVSHLYLLLGELSTMAGVSLSTQQPESLQQKGSNHIQNAVKRKVEMMNRLQHALDQDLFVLMAQRIEGLRGDAYYEVLLRMRDDKGELLSPDIFLPVAHEFGLSSRIDRWVLNAALQFMDKHRDSLPGCRLAINLTPASVCQAQLPGDVQHLLAKYRIEPWQLVFEVTESHSLTNLEQANVTLKMLQRMGCRVAIDDFGTGYASYARLKELSADILKIDGSFIRNILTSSLDYQVVSSICQLARMKKMQVVAEYVETQALKDAVRAMGMDYVQGYLIGRPQPLESLAEEQSPSAPEDAKGLME